MSGSRIPISEESFIDYDNDLSKEVFGDLYECVGCDEVKDLSEFIDTECDGDVIGTCPNCGTRTMLLPVS